MKPATIALAAVLSAAFGTQARAADSLPGPAAKPAPRAVLDSVPSFPRVYAGSEGLPPADPLASDLYRSAPKLYAGVEFTPYTGIEARFMNPDRFEGERFTGFGPRPAGSIPLGVDGFNVDVVVRRTVPVDTRLGAFGELGVSVAERRHRDAGSREIGPAASVGATYRLNNRQTMKAEVPLGAIGRKTLTGAAGALGGHMTLGF